MVKRKNKVEDPGRGQIGTNDLLENFSGERNPKKIKLKDGTE